MRANQIAGWALCAVVPLLLSFDPLLASPDVLGPALSKVFRASHDVLLLALGGVLAWRVVRGKDLLPGSLGVAAALYLGAAAVSLTGLIGTPLFDFAYVRVVLTAIVTWALIVGVLAPALTDGVRMRLLLVALGLRAVVFAVYRIYAVVTMTGPEVRVTPFGHLNASAGYAVLLLPIFAGLLMESRRWIHKGLLGAALILMVVGLVTTGSRGALLALAVGAVVATALAKGGRAGGAAAVLLGLALLLAPLSLTRRLATVASPSYPTNEYRVELWRNTLDIASRRPLLGVGYESLWYFYRPYLNGSSEALAGGHAHNIVLHTLAETGVLGLASLSFLLCLAIRRAWRWWRECRSWLALAIMSSLLVMMAHGLVDTVFREYHVQVFFWCLVALLCFVGGRDALQRRPVAHEAEPAR